MTADRLLLRYFWEGTPTKINLLPNKFENSAGHFLRVHMAKSAEFNIFKSIKFSIVYRNKVQSWFVEHRGAASVERSVPVIKHLGYVNLVFPQNCWKVQITGKLRDAVYEEIDAPYWYLNEYIRKNFNISNEIRTTTFRILAMELGKSQLSKETSSWEVTLTSTSKFTATLVLSPPKALCPPIR